LGKDDFLIKDYRSVNNSTRFAATSGLFRARFKIQPPLSTTEANRVPAEFLVDLVQRPERLSPPLEMLVTE
jgi:hypothetical protein